MSMDHVRTYPPQVANKPWKKYELSVTPGRQYLQRRAHGLDLFRQRAPLSQAADMGLDALPIVVANQPDDVLLRPADFQTWHQLNDPDFFHVRPSRLIRVETDSPWHMRRPLPSPQEQNDSIPILEMDCTHRFPAVYCRVLGSLDGCKTRLERHVS